MGASFPPFNLPILQIPGWILLLWLGQADSIKESRIRYGLLYVLVWNLFATYWLMMATLAGGLAAIIANSFLMLIPLTLIWKIQDSKRLSWYHALSIAGIWTAFEFFHHQWQLSWPWLTLGNAWSVWPGLIQWISMTGHLGISFWVISVSTLLGLGFQKFPDVKPAIVGGCLLILLPFGSFSGVWNYFSIDEKQEDQIEVIIVQPDQNSLLPYGGYGSLDRLIDHLTELTESAITQETDLILWPENAIDGAVQLGSATLLRLKELSHRWGAELITGAMLVETYLDLKTLDSLSTLVEIPETPLLKRQSDDGTSYNIYNAALHFGNGYSIDTGSSPGIYKKANLVPIVERVPYVEVLSQTPFLSRLDWASLQGYGKGREATIFQIKTGSITAPLICYDSVYPDWVRQFVLQGASVLTIITNDGWWGDTSGHTQHFEFAKLRAIEFHRPVLRSANNGISGVILPNGSVLTQTEYATEDVLRIQLPIETKATFYARAGNWVGWGSFILTLVALLNLRRKSSI